jgi:hypothetical protein
MRLTEMTGLDRVFRNTGTEAWEGALKLARAHAGLLRSEGKEDRNEVSGARAELSRADIRDRCRRRTRRSIASRLRRWCRGWSLCASTMWRPAREVFRRGLRDSG